MKYSTNTLLYAGLAMTLLSACEGAGGNKSSQGMSNLPAYTMRIEHVEARQDSCAEGSCTYASFDIPRLGGGNDTVREMINADIEILVRENIKARLPEPMSQGTLDAMAQYFVEGYELFVMEFPDNNAFWFLEIDGSESAMSQQYFVLKLDVSDYMGGAHPNSFTLLQNYSLQDGTPVDVLQHYDEPALLAMAETAFRQKNGLGANDALNDAGFFFPNGVFTLPENMALTDSGLVLLYNPYEVASYAQGTTTLLLPLPEALSNP